MSTEIPLMRLYGWSYGSDDGEPESGSSMKNPEEHLICGRRGHDFPGLGGVNGLIAQWRQCKWCRVWQREVRTVEEREDTPPKEEQDPLQGVLRKAKGSRRTREKRK